MEQKGLSKEVEEEERGPEDVITSFVYQRQKPFNPSRLYKVLREAFMMEIVLPQEGDEDEEGEAEQEEHNHQHNHNHDEEEKEDPEYDAKLAAAKEKYKQSRDLAVESKKTTVFKDVVRSKGFLWLSNRPELFFEWQEAAISGVFQVGGPWLATLNGGTLEEQAARNDIGDRAQNLVFIGMNMT